MKKIAQLMIVGTAFLTVAYTVPKSNDKTYTIVIDAGHGGHDAGASQLGVTEKDIVAQISSKIKSLNQNKNIVLHFTRTNDEYVELLKRAEMINEIQPDLFLSLHVNSNANRNVSGTEFYVSKTSTEEKSKELAGKLNSIFVKNNQFKSGSIKNAPYMILKKSTVPGMIVELGFISNEHDKLYLTDPKEQDKIATSILEFITAVK